MAASPTIERIELSLFEADIPDMSADPSGFGIHYTPGQSPPQLRLAIKVFGDTGVVGEYVPGRGRAKIIHAAAAALGKAVIHGVLQQLGEHDRQRRCGVRRDPATITRHDEPHGTIGRLEALLGEAQQRSDDLDERDVLAWLA